MKCRKMSMKLNPLEINGVSFSGNYLKCDRHAPIKDIRITENKPPWLTRDIIEQICHRDDFVQKG